MNPWKKTMCFAKFLVIGLAALSFSGCSKYTIKPLSVPKTPNLGTKDIAIHAVALDRKAWKPVLGDVPRYFCYYPQAFDYQPIQISIGNHTDQTYIMNTGTISIPLVPAEKVIRKMVRRLRFLLATEYIFLSPLFIRPDPVQAFIFGGVGSLCSLLFPMDVPELEMKTMSNGQTFEIEPDGVLNKIIFVKTKSYKSTFKLSLINKETAASECFTIDLDRVDKK